MAREIYFTPEAEATLAHIEAYILANFGFKRLLKFDEDFDAFLDRIEALPYAGRLVYTPHGSFRERIFQRLTSLYYTIEANKIIVHFVYDNRQDKDSTRKLH